MIVFEMKWETSGYDLNTFGKAKAPYTEPVSLYECLFYFWR